MTRITVDLDLSVAAALIMAVDAISKDAPREYVREAERGSRAIRAAMKRMDDQREREREEAQHAAAAEVARLAAIESDMPFANPRIVQPHAYPGSRPTRLSCEIHVYSGARYDFAGHVCGNVATWLRPDFDEWGDIALCYRHHNDANPGQRAVYGGYNKAVIDGAKVVLPMSLRFGKREWLAIRNARKVAKT